MEKVRKRCSRGLVGLATAFLTQLSFAGERRKCVEAEVGKTEKMRYAIGRGEGISRGDKSTGESILRLIIFHGFLAVTKS